MISRNFRIQCSIRVALLAATLSLFSYLLVLPGYTVTSLLLVLFAVCQLFELFHYISATNRLLSLTFEAILHDDFSTGIKNIPKDALFGELKENLNALIVKLQKGRLEREHQFQHLQAVVLQAGIGLLSMRQGGEFCLVNKSAERILQTSRISTLSQLAEVDPGLPQLLESMADGEQRDYSLPKAPSPARLVIYARDIMLHGEQYRIFTLQSIQHQLERQEIEAWQDLMRILSHEIMNSVTPISSLASTTKLLLGEGNHMPSGNLPDIHQAIDTIEKRSEGLMAFINNYRKLARVPEPRIKVVKVADLFLRIEKLLQTELNNRQIKFSRIMDPPNLHLRIDQDLIEQALLNLMANAIEATKQTSAPEITLSAGREENIRPFIRITDNGQGIESGALDKIFIPFFTTRRNGSGIGLSLSRQIMYLHGGSIKVHSRIGEGSSFSLFFPEE